MEDIKCQVCATQEIFENMVAIGYEPDEAFHLAVTHLLSNLIEKAIDEGFEAGHKEGYAEATNDLAVIVGAYAESVNDEK